MGEPGSSERLQRLEREIRAELQDRKDVTGFEIVPTEDRGVHLEVDEADEVRLYHVTLEELPDGTEETHWSIRL